MATNKAYYESLPQKRMGAGCLIFDEHRRILLVKPTYKPTWVIPGGVVELNESSMQCCLREVREEIGLEPRIGNLLVVDYNTASEDKTESLMFNFNGSWLSPAEIASIRLLEEEISQYRFVESAHLPDDMTATLRRRIMEAWRQAGKNSVVYLENQE